MYLFLILRQVLSATFGLYDQQNKQNFCFNQDWYFQQNAESSPISNYCNTDSCGTLGGFLGQLNMESKLYRTYTNLDAHTKIQIKVTFIKIDDYVFDYIQIAAGTTIDTKQIYKILLQEGGAITSQNPQLTINDISAPSTACHSSQGSGSSKSFDVVLLIDHTDNTFFVQFQTDYIATTRAWGIRNYEFYLEIDCIVNCNKCTSQSYCTECAANRVSTPNCLCPTGYYDNGIAVCQKCLTQCQTCSIGTSCTSCPSGRGGSLCLCNPGTYDQNGLCASCSYQCSTCNNSDNECTSCALNRISIPTCTCAQGYYQSNISCLQCSYKCETCDNQSSCLTCSNTKRTLPDCLCPTYEVQGQSTCSQCPQFCDQCNSLGCTSCQDGYYLINNQCQKCSYMCAKCNINGCLTCSDVSRKIQNQCKCQSYEIENQAVCPICSPQCYSCDQNGCTSCLGSNRQTPSCGCLSNYYLSNQECVPCPSQCSSCDSNGCQSCYDNIHILPKCECPQGSTDVRGKCILTTNVFTNVFAQFSDDLLSVIIYFSGVQDISTSLGTLDQTPSQSNCNLVNQITGKCYLQGLTFRIQLNDFHQYNTNTVINVNDGAIIINGKQNLVFPNMNIQGKQIYPQFNLQYQQIILTCKSYQFSINNILNIGNTYYQMNIQSNPQIQGLDQKLILENLKISNYTISVSITNFLGYSNKTDIQIQVVDQQVPFIKFEPLLNDIYAYQEIHINAEIGIESCSNTNRSNNIQTKWIIDGVSQSNFASTSYLTKVFQEYYFKPNTQHKISMVAQLGEIIQQSDIILNIKQSPILIQTVGGSRVVSTYDDIYLEASIADLDKVGYNISWLCVETITQNPCSIQFNNSNQQIIPRGSLNSFISYTVTVKANNYVKSIQLLLKDIGTNQLLVSYPSRYTSQPVNLNENLIFVAQLQQDGVKSNLSPTQTIKYNIIQNGSIIYSQTQSQSVISFQLQQFPIQDTVVQFVYQDQVSYLTLVPNQGPAGGYLQIDQLGYSMSTLISMELLDFKDANIPLQYQFSFINNDQQIILNEWSYQNSLVTKLPQGRFMNNYNITIIGEVSDSLGAVTILYKNVTIRPQNNRILQSGSKLIQQIQQSILNGEDLSLYSYQYSNMQQDGCLKNCSNNGVCTSNQCQCKSGYYLDDCSLVEQDFNDVVKAMNDIISYLQQQQKKTMSQTKSQQLADSIRMSLSRIEIQQSLNSSQLQTASQQAQSQLLNLLSDQSIQKANTKNLLTNPPDPAKQRRIQQINNNTQSQTLIMDQLYTSTGKYNSSQFEDSSQQDTLNRQMMIQTRNVTSFFANQLYVDQDPQIINGTNLQINSQRLSNQQSIKYLPSSSFIFYNLDEDEMDILYQQGLGDELEVSTILINTNPHVADSQFPYQNQTNQFIIPIINNKEGIPQKPKQKLAYTLKIKNSKNNVCITQKENKWTTDGCAQLNTLLLGESTCSCNTITEVTIVDDIANMFANSNLSALWNPEALVNFKFWESGLFYTSTGLFVAWCICIAIGYKKDKVDYQHFLSHKTEEKKVQQVEVDYDTDEEERKKKEILKKNRRIAKEFIYGFPMLHNFVSIFTVFSDEHPRPARFTIYFLKMTVMMTLTSIFGARLTITQNVVFAVLCVGLMTPITIFLTNGFAHDATKQKKIICVVIIINIFAGCYYVCLTVAAKMGVDQSNQWLLTYLLSLLLDILIMETISIFLKLLIVPYIKAHIHSGNFIIRILYLYMFDEQIDIVLSKVN